METQKMFKKTTLAVALSLFAIPAFAQTTVGTVQVSAEGLPHVASYCDEIGSMSVSDRSDYTPGLAQSVASGISLKTITVSDCERAGLI
tara:strand:- start:19438 stop:19704 length:267 start_codon:yes stop_codon:yes gene_type:complete